MSNRLLLFYESLKLAAVDVSIVKCLISRKLPAANDSVYAAVSPYRIV